jgi:uncharacterized membrane protein
MLREYIIDPVYEIWQFQVLPGIQALWDSALFWRLVVLMMAVLFLLKALQREKED